MREGRWRGYERGMAEVATVGEQQSPCASKQEQRCSPRQSMISAPGTPPGAASPELAPPAGLLGDTPRPPAGQVALVRDSPWGKRRRRASMSARSWLPVRLSSRTCGGGRVGGSEASLAASNQRRRGQALDCPAHPPTDLAVVQQLQQGIEVDGGGLGQHRVLPLLHSGQSSDVKAAGACRPGSS